MATTSRCPRVTNHTVEGSVSGTGASEPTSTDVPTLARSSWNAVSRGVVSGTGLSLGADEARVGPIDGVQLAVRAALHDVASVEDDDLVGVADGAEAVRDDDAGAATAAAILAATD